MKYCPACHRTYPTEYNVCPADQNSLQSAHELQPGMVIRNKYEILEQIGIGGMGFVYRGRHITFNELCAIKIVNDAIAGDANFLQRFQTEAVVTRKLRHPNAVRVEDYDYTDDGRPFIVMELVEGKNVSQILQEEGPMSPPRAIRITIQVARALGTAHKLGIVHRDIKPGNIVLTLDEQGQESAKVLDFGIAKLREAVSGAKGGMSMTMTGMVVGTPLYMSPEQFMGKKGSEEIDGRTDLYSLGVVLYQMVTARLPFDGDTLYSLMMQHMEGNVRPPHELTPELRIPEALSRVIVKAIDKSRDLRYQTADELIAALEQVPADPAGIVQAARPPVVATPVPGSTPSSGQRSSAQTPPSARTVAIPPPTGVAPSAPTPRTTPIPTTPAPLPPPGSGTTPAWQPVPSTTQVAPPQTIPTVAAVPQSTVGPVNQPDSGLVKSAEQHVLLQPKKTGVKSFIVVMVLLIAVAVVSAVGYLKYQEIRRVRIETAINEKLSAASSEPLHSVRVSVSEKREVTLDGKVASMQDFAMATTLAASVDGVTYVNNRLAVDTPKPTQNPGGTQTESPQSLIDKGTAFLDTGDYSSAIDCFARAAADPGTKDKAQALLERAQRAQATEEKLLKNRR